MALPTIKSKLPHTGTSIFSVMSALANETGAINLSQGFPDFQGSKELIRLVNGHMKSGHNQYAPMQGIFPLRERIAEKMENLYSATINPEKEINITSGATEAIYAAITAIISDGDEVIVFEPSYDCYVPAIQLNGGIPIFIPLTTPEFTINWEAVKNRINHKTRMIIINTPHNPSGSVLNAFDMMQLEKITKNTDITILSDEVYEHIIFDKLDHQSVLRFPGLWERSMVVFSFGKTYHNTGWKLGYCLAPEYLMKEFRRVHQFIVFSSMTPVQHALADFMVSDTSYFGLADLFQEKRDLFARLLSGSRFKLKPSSGTYFQFVDYSRISNEPDFEFSTRITREFKVASIPVSSFYSQKTDNKLIRLCFAKSNQTLEQAAERLCKI